MIGEAVLREVIGANLLAAVSRAHHGLALFSESLLLLFHLDFVEAGAQDAHAFLAILDLRLFVLAADNCVGGNVRDAHGGVGCVHRLPARTGRAERVNPQVFGFDLDVDVFGFGKNGDRDSGGVDASLLLGGGDALHAVHSTLVFQLRIDAVALDDGDHFLQAASR